MRTCLACGSQYDVIETRTADYVTWAKCPVCGLLSDVDPKPEVGDIWYPQDVGVLPEGWQYDTTDHKISRVLAGEVQPWHVVLDRLLMSLPSDFPALSGIFLDVGCGAGEILDYARELGRWSWVVGTETTRHYVAFTRSRGHEVFYRNLATSAIPELENRVTLAMCNEVMEHVPDPVSLLRGIGKHLHAEGVLFVTFAVPMDVLNPGEWHYWTEQASCSAICRAGLVPICIESLPYRFEILCRRNS